MECVNEKIRIGIAYWILHILKILGPYEYPIWQENEKIIINEGEDKEQVIMY